MTDVDSKKLAEAKKEYEEGRNLHAGGNYVKALEARITEQDREIERLNTALTQMNLDHMEDWQTIEADNRRLRELLQEWLYTPFFETKEAWQEWVNEYRPRVEQALQHKEGE